jgi:hypothetical protein
MGVIGMWPKARAGKKSHSDNGIYSRKQRFQYSSSCKIQVDERSGQPKVKVGNLSGELGNDRPLYLADCARLFRFLSKKAGEKSNRLAGCAAVNANRWLSLTSETPLLDPALEKYNPVSAPALPFRQTCGVRPGDIRAFWAAKSTFRVERHQEREKARLAGGEDWIRTRGCVSLDVRDLLADKVRISPVCGKQRVPIGESGRLHGAGASVQNQSVRIASSGGLLARYR